jgi:pimeloyl-ACP methyl ester carboxylesterase
MALRPSQIRAVSEDGALMIPSVLTLSRHYKEITKPVTIIAGDDDKIVYTSQAEKLASRLSNSLLIIIKGAGHMAHYSAPEKVAEAVLNLNIRSLPHTVINREKSEHMARAV